MPVNWRLPEFMTPIGTGEHVPERGIALSRSFPDLAHKNGVLSEYVALSAIKRLLAGTDVDSFVGFCHYRRFVLTRPVGTLSGFNYIAHPKVLEAMGPGNFIGDGRTPVIPAIVHFNIGLLQQFARTSAVRDLLLFFADAVDCGVLSNEDAANFLAGNKFIVAPTVSYIPVKWFVEIVDALELVTARFLAHHYMARDGYQSRNTAFCCERLHALLLAKRADAWGWENLISQPLVLLDEAAPPATGNNGE